MRSKYLNALGLITIAAVMGMANTQHAFADDDGDGRRLQGSWVVQISLQNCQTNAPIGEPFLSLLTFAHGGTMTETTSNPVFFPAVRGPGHGVWSHAGYNKYIAVSTAFVTVNGALTSTQTIAQTIEVETENSFKTTTASVKFYKPDGTLAATGCATATGKRIELEP